MSTFYRSKATRLCETLTRDIWANMYPRDSYLPTEDELMEKYGVSRMTIRKVLATLERDNVIVKIPSGNMINPGIELPESDDKPVKNSPLTIASVMAAFPDTLTIEVNMGIQAYAQEHDISFRLFQNAKGPEALFSELSRLQEGYLSGLICLGFIQEYVPTILHYEKINFPLVYIDNPMPESSAPYVSIDNFGGMYLAASSMLKTLHRNLYYLGETPTVLSKKLRYEGYCRAMIDFGLRDEISTHTSFFNQKMSGKTWFGPSHDLPAIKAAEKILSQSGPLGIVTENDYIAQNVLDVAQKMSLEAGKDFLLCGFDDLPLANARNLSSVHQPRFELGYEAARILHAQIERKEIFSLTKIIPAAFVERGSSVFQH